LLLSLWWTIRMILRKRTCARTNREHTRCANYRPTQPPELESLRHFRRKLFAPTPVANYQ
jgi:hypothetical protein